MGTSIGIFGDPNSGKSILSFHLYNELLSRGASVFRQEGDPAAPTACWFLEGKDRNLCNETRKVVKKPFTTAMATWVRDSIKGLKKTKDIVLVDLGGGMPPTMRVTPELDTIIPEIDKAILLCPVDGDPACHDTWRCELMERDVPIIKECWSRMDGESTVDASRCIISGLDRDIAANPPEHLKRAVKVLADHVITGT